MRNLATFFIILFAYFQLSGQELKIQEPEYLGNIIFVTDSSNFIKLEKQKVGSKAKANAAAYVPYAGLVAGKVKGMNTIQGAKSSVRIEKKSNLNFIIKVSDNRIEPFELFNIFKLEQNVKKDYRFLEVASTSTFGGSSSMEIAYIPFSAKKYGESSFIIEIQEELAPGEYAITIEGSRDIFNLFGINE